MFTLIYRLITLNDTYSAFNLITNALKSIFSDKLLVNEGADVLKQHYKINTVTLFYSISQSIYISFTLLFSQYTLLLKCTHAVMKVLIFWAVLLAATIHKVSLSYT